MYGRLLTEADVRFLSPIIPYIRGVNVSAARRASFFAKKRVLEEFLFGDLKLDTTKVAIGRYLFETSAELTSEQKSALKKIQSLAEEAFENVNKEGNNDRMTKVMGKLFSLMLGTSVTLLLEGARRLKKKKKEKKKKMRLFLFESELLQGAHRFVGDLIHKLSSVKVKDRTFGEDVEQISYELAKMHHAMKPEIDRVAKYIDPKYKNMMRQYSNELSDTYEKYMQLRNELDNQLKQGKITQLERDSKLYRELKTKVLPAYYYTLEKVDKTLKKAEGVEVGGVEGGNFLSRSVRRLKNWILGLCSKIYEKRSPDSWIYKSAKFVCGKFDSFVEHLIAKWKWYALAYLLLIGLLFYLATKDIPVISDMARAILKVLTAPFRLLWRVISWVLEKLGIFSKSEIMVGTAEVEAAGAEPVGVGV